MGTGKTHGFDLVIELAEDPIVALLGDAIDSSDLLSDMFGGEGDLDLSWELRGVESEFLFDVSFDRDEGLLAPTQTNAIDIRMSASLSLGVGGGLLSWPLGVELRWIVGAAIDRRAGSESTLDVPVVDFEDRLYHSALEVDDTAFEQLIDLIRPILPLIPDVDEASLRDGWSDFEDSLRARMDAFLRETIGKLPIAFPMPVHPGTVDPAEALGMDLKTIGDADTSPNALALLVTFGEGAGGDVGDFTESFLESVPGDVEEPAELAWAMLDFLWIGRLIAAKLKESDAFAGASFVHERLPSGAAVTRLQAPFAVDPDEGVFLDALALTFDPTLAADRFTLTGKVSKRGFCYEASAELGGSVTIAVVEPAPDSDEGGKIVVTGEILDPDVDLDIPWYCWLLGILTFGALFGVVGIMIAVAIGLIVEAIEGVFDWIANEIVDALNGLTEDEDGQNTLAELPTGQLELKPIDAFIDDASLVYDVKYEGLAPIRCEGIALLRDGQGLELDNGRVTGADLPSTDLRFVEGALEVGCAAEMAKLADTHFERQLRFMLYDEPYTRPLAFREDEYTRLDSIGGATLKTPSLRLLALRSDEGRYSLVQVVAVGQGYVRVRYRTWEGPIRTLRIDGDFVCRRAFVPGKISDPIFEPAREAGARPRPKAGCGCNDAKAPASAAGDSPPPTTAVVSTVATHAMAMAPGAATGGPVVESRCYRDGLRDDHERARHFSTLARLAAMTGEATIGQAAVGMAGEEARLVDIPAAIGTTLHANRLPRLSNVGGRYVATVRWERSRRATFRAVETGVKAATRREWRVDGERLEGEEGTIDIPGNQLRYALSKDGREVVLTLRDATETAFGLSVEVEEGGAPRLVSARCVRFTATCSRSERAMPPELADAKMLVTGT